jgi:preprotein translocase SecE subunit
MKVINKACQVLATLCGIAALVFFFFNFASLDTDKGLLSVSGLQMGFGSEVIEGTKIAKSADVLFCFLLSVLGVALSVFTFFSKSKGLKYFASGVNATVAIYMLVVALSTPWKFVDTRPFVTTGVEYTPFVLIVSLVMFAALIFSVAYFLLDDYIEVLESKGSKKFILKRIVQFFKDYKSECKKIVWPGLKEVLKNTGIVLVMFIVIGAIIWLVDFGLGTLLESIWK